MSTITPTVKSWLRKAAHELQSADIPSAKLDAEVLLASTLKVDRSWLIAHEDNELKRNVIEQLDARLIRRIAHEPIAYIVGRKEFYGRNFTVTPDTLIPRPETEALIDIVKSLAPRTILDVGCGSGCIGLTLQAELPDASVTLSDISPQTLLVARQNSQSLGIEAVQFKESDLLSFWASQTERLQFDVIVANLPYVAESWEVSPETAYEPQSALYAEDDGLELIKQLIDDAPMLLPKNGHLLLEADPRQLSAISSYALHHDMKTVSREGFAILLKRS